MDINDAIHAERKCDPLRERTGIYVYVTMSQDHACEYEYELRDNIDNKSFFCK